MINQFYKVDREFLAPLDKSCSNLSSSLNEIDNDDARLTTVVAKWKSEISKSIDRIQAGVNGNAVLREYVIRKSDSVASNIRLCLTQLKAKETSIVKRALARPDPISTALLVELRSTTKVLEKANDVIPIEIVTKPSKETTIKVLPPTEVTSATLISCFSDLIFGLPVRQLLSELAFSITWCLRKCWMFSIKSVSLNPLKTLAAVVPCILGTMSWCVISLYASITKKALVDMPLALLGIFKPEAWMKNPEETRREESSRWLEKGWFKITVWGEKWIDWVFE